MRLAGGKTGGNLADRPFKKESAAGVTFPQNCLPANSIHTNSVVTSLIFNLWRNCGVAVPMLLAWPALKEKLSDQTSNLGKHIWSCWWMNSGRTKKVHLSGSYSALAGALSMSTIPVL